VLPDPLPATRAQTSTADYHTALRSPKLPSIARRVTMQARHHIRGVPDEDEATSVARQTAIPDPRSGDERRRSTEEATGSVTPGRRSNGESTVTPHRLGSHPRSGRSGMYSPNGTSLVFAY
jgi:hypothetical protein